MSSFNSHLTLYIPRVFENISKNRIASTFEDLNFGVVSRIDLISKQSENGRNYNSAYVHFEHWYDNPTTRSFQERILDPAREARVVYDDPWYWIVLENKGKRHVAGDRKPKIDLNDRSSSLSRPSTHFVSADYVAQLEHQVYMLQMQLQMQQQLQMHSQSALSNESDYQEPMSMRELTDVQ